MKKTNRRLLINGLLAGGIVSTVACSAVSFTHATGAKGQSVTNAEVQPNNTVVLTYPNGSACIDTHPEGSQTCKQGGP
ncbi:hypothetical protein JHW33_08465 [Rahnella aceris]|uniref:hypothetical protein n=1 Tax=Rahnella sp. (strain Y9602) TaxID=2703885 RepID=UPI0019074040|nr:hypothetical protein [Rahnella aceris]QQN36626.1 hypothetical protein JHW33_08465 [Rahnella aceris]